MNNRKCQDCGNPIYQGVLCANCWSKRTDNVGVKMSHKPLKDSGQRRTFTTGAVRDRGELKPRPDLISPHAMLREGMIFALGAQKYAIRNWEMGMPISECLASAQRHIEQYKRGDTDEDHLAQARWNLGAIIHFEEEIAAGRLPAELDDMPKYGQQFPLHHPKVIGAVKEGIEEVKKGEFVRCSNCNDFLTGVPPACPTCRIFFEHGGQKIPLVELPYMHPPGVLTEDGEITFVDRLTGKCYRRQKATFYLCGPMRGYPRLNFDQFDYARDLGTKLGYRCISPADLDREAGIDPDKPDTLELKGQEWLDTIVQRDVNAIMFLDPTRDGIAVLPGWEKSTGARAEVALAKWRGLRIVSTFDFKTPVEVKY